MTRHDAAWRRPTPTQTRDYPGGPLAELVAVREHERRLALCWTETRDGELWVTVGVTDEAGRVTATTANTDQWPLVEALVPRAEWPWEIRRRANQDGAPAPLRALLDDSEDEEEDS